ncbi:MAG TPA: RidA family protein [Candidatus Baltobacteraceae bacterium]|jgi:enamine deaminase RidA (YjgF/YER057c/UK114 family)
MSDVVRPDGWPQPRGYSDGILATGRLLFVAGQIGWNERGEFVSDDFGEQTAQALRNVVAIVAAAGGRPEQIVRLTWYVTDKRAYRNALAQIGAAYRTIVGAHYPAMTLVQVAALLEDRALVEIEATAVL